MSSAVHLVTGSGNLGCALVFGLQNRGFDVVHIPFDLVDSWTEDDFPDLKDMTVIWHCTGGRHREARKDQKRSFRHNVELPRIFMERSPYTTRLVFFSTLECAHQEYPARPHMRNPDPQSEYVRQKLMMEGLIMARNRPYSAYVRLGALYGEYQPHQTFPGRLLREEWKESAALSLPMNEVVPTPVDWVADALIRGMDRNLWNPSTYTCHHLAPLGSISAFDWAKVVFGQGRAGSGFFEKVTWDHTRPRIQLGGSSIDVIDEHWSTLWAKYFQPEAYQRI